jgi:hypothetical protein
MQGLVTALAVADIVVKDDKDWSAILPGRLSEETYLTKSLFHWITIGSGGLFSRIPHVVRNSNRTDSFYQRDSAAIAYASRDINHQHLDPVFWSAMDGLDYEIESVVVLGSGSGERLM